MKSNIMYTSEWISSNSCLLFSSFNRATSVHHWAAFKTTNKGGTLQVALLSPLICRTNTKLQLRYQNPSEFTIFCEESPSGYHFITLTDTHGSLRNVLSLCCMKQDGGVLWGQFQPFSLEFFNIESGALFNFNITVDRPPVVVVAWLCASRTTDHLSPGNSWSSK